MKLHNILQDTLKKEQNFITDNGEIKKWVVINYAQNQNEKLIELLLKNEELREKFFKNIKGYLIFDYKLFVSFIENKNYFNNSYTKYKNKIGLTIGNKYLKQLDEVSLVWPFKDTVLEGGQSKEEQKKSEIFFNEVLAQDEINQLFEPKVLTNSYKNNLTGEISNSDNFIIKGNNLLTLYTLLPVFERKIKLIYIDPPYNTGGDSFGYNDNFTHSAWLTFMKNRLEIAKKLLTKDGSIFVQLDWNEVHYGKVLLDSIFGRDNFRNEIIWAYHGPGSPKMKQYNRKHDNILWYSNSATDWVFNGDDVRMSSEVHVGGFNNEMNADVSKDYTSKGKIPEDWWETGRDKNEFLQEMGILYDEYLKIKDKDWWKMAVAARIRVDGEKRTGYLTEKPYKLIERIIKAHSNSGDIVLDFFAGSGTTGIMASKLGRQFILIEQLENTHTIIKKRFNDVEYVYYELKKYNQTFIEQIGKAKNTKKLLFIWKQMKEKSFLDYNLDIKKQDEEIEDFKNLPINEQKQHLFDVLDKNQIYVNLSSIDDKDFEVSETEKNFTNEFYSLRK